MLKVSRSPGNKAEIFFSIQGEGINAGKPAVFIRLALCNLKCSWCDTKYTWDWPSGEADQHYTEMQQDQIEAAISGYSCKYFVATGGEPLLQQKDLIPLLGRLQDRGFFVEIETNATVVPDNDLLTRVDHWSVSPKLSSSANLGKLREVPECYRLFAYINNSHFKFVIQNGNDLDELLSNVNKYHIPADKIILMPESQSREELLVKSRELVEICKVHDFRFSIRLQTLLWGNERGK